MNSETGGWSGIYCPKHPEVELGLLIGNDERCFACLAIVDEEDQLRAKMEGELEDCLETERKLAVDMEWERLANEAEGLMDCKSLPELENAVEDLGSDDEWLGRLALWGVGSAEDQFERVLTIDGIAVEFTEPDDMERGFFVLATAQVSYQKAVAGRRLEWLSSAGISEVEGDSGYLREIALEQLEDLREHLAEFGVDLSNFNELAKEALK